MLGTNLRNSDHLEKIQPLSILYVYAVHKTQQMALHESPLELRGEG